MVLIIAAWPLTVAKGPNPVTWAVAKVLVNLINSPIKVFNKFTVVFPSKTCSVAVLDPK